MNTNELNKANKTHWLLVFALVLYVASAIAYECTASTARISTLAIYFLFLVGGYFIFTRQILHFSTYTICTILFALYVFIMYFPILLGSTPKVSQTSYHVVYVNFTCMVLCVITYMLVYHNPGLIKWIVLANIIGAIILAYRVVNIYESIEVMLEYASDTDMGEHRIGVEIINANMLGLYMSNAILCCVTVMMVVKKKKFFVRMSLVVLIVALAALALLAGSKKAIAFILLGIIAMAIFMSRGQSANKKTFIFLIGIIVFAFVIWAVMSLEFFATIRLRIEEMFMAFEGERVSQTDQNRARFINEGIDAFWKNPIFGNGTGYSYRLFNTYSHNNFVELLMNYGIIGFILHYVPFVILIFKMYEKAKTKDIYSTYLLVYAIILLFMGFALVSYYERVMQLLIAAAWGYCDSDKTEMILNEN